jgi:hypothetical protein
MTDPTRCPGIGVGANALGVLAAEDADAFEKHLAECATCAAELRELTAVATVLADIDPRLVMIEPPPRMRARTLVLCAVAGILVTGGAVTAAAAVPSREDRAPATAPAVSMARRVAQTSTYSRMVDRRSGVSGGIALSSGPGGAEFTLFVRGLPAAVRSVVLVAVTGRGAASVAGVWAITDPGSLRGTGALSLPQGDVERLEVRAADNPRPLLTIHPR